MNTMASIRSLLAMAGLLLLSDVCAMAAEESRLRARDLGITIGGYQPGPLNAITDVAGVTVGHVTLVRGEGTLKPGEGPVRTGVTVIIPRDDVWHKKVPAAGFVLNGTGERRLTMVYATVSATTARCTNIRLSMTSGNIATGRFILFGGL